MSRTFSLRTQLAVFTVLFASGMWLSKVAQPLHFYDDGALLAFGVGYAVMALVGGLSFAWGALADKIGGLNAVLIGATLYAVGIAGRVFTDLLPAILCSAVAGAGASLALVGIRPWVRSQATDEEIPGIVASRNLSNQVGVFIGTVGAAAIFAIETRNGPVLALAAAPILVFAGVLWLFVAARSDVSSPASVLPTSAETNSPPEGRKGLAVRLAILGVISGFYVSLVAPYAPVILTHAGLTDTIAAVCIAATSAAQIGATAWLTKRTSRPRPFRLFILTELGTAILTFAIALALHTSWIIIAIAFVLRAALLAVAATAEETIQYAVIPAAAAGFIFGISQTAFLIGDAVGGAFGAVIWNTSGPMGMMLIAGSATLLNAVLLPTLLGRRAKHAEAAVGR